MSKSKEKAKMFFHNVCLCWLHDHYNLQQDCGPLYCSQARSRPLVINWQLLV